MIFSLIVNNVFKVIFRLLIDNGHDFRPFEDEFRNYDFIDCGDYLTAKSGICGDQNSLKNLRPLTTQEMIRYTKKLR